MICHSHSCHPVIYELEPVKNTNKISIFYYFLDLVPKPRYDIEAFFDPHRMTYIPKEIKKHEYRTEMATNLARRKSL